MSTQILVYECSWKYYSENGKCKCPSTVEGIEWDKIHTTKCNHVAIEIITLRETRQESTASKIQENSNYFRAQKVSPWFQGGWEWSREEPPRDR